MRLYIDQIDQEGTLRIQFGVPSGGDDGLTGDFTRLVVQGQSFEGIPYEELAAAAVEGFLDYDPEI
jgi:hypothetical protein